MPDHRSSSSRRRLAGPVPKLDTQAFEFRIPEHLLSRADRRRRQAILREACRRLGLQVFVDTRSGRLVVDSSALAAALNISMAELIQRYGEPPVSPEFMSPAP